jgi:long-chain fatty acid transport protein
MRLLFALIFAGLALFIAPVAYGQTYGVELHNTLMPASSGMGGTSFSQPQDLQSAIYGNPATMLQFQGTQAAFSSAWAEPTINFTQTSNAPAIGVSPYQGKSQAPGSLVGNIGVVFDSQMMGRPIKMGLGFMTNAGLGVDFRQIPESNGSNTSFLELDLVAAAAMQMTDRLSAGATFYLGTGVLNAPLVGISSTSMNYAARGALGLNYDLGAGVTLGAYWQSKKAHTFYDLVRVGSSFQDINMDLPANTGIGIANSGLMNGRLLLAADVLFKNYGDADFFKAIYQDQWAFQFGSQYKLNQRIRLRTGYAYNTSVARDSVPGTIGGVVPIGGLPAVEYLQAQFVNASQHRLTGGVGIRDIMPGMDFDASVGGMFLGEDTFGSATTSTQSYWVAFGFTWRCSGPANSYSSFTASDQTPMEYTSQIMQ